MLCKIKKSFVLLVITYASIITAASASETFKEKLEENVFYKNITAELEVLTYTWTIENFYLNNYTKGDGFNSPPFGSKRNNTNRWKLRLNPKGHLVEEGDVSLYLFDHSHSNVSANVYLGLLNDQNKLIFSKNFFYHFGPTDNLGYSKFVRQDFLTNKNNRLLVNNTLKIFCKIETTISTSLDPTKKFNNNFGTDLAVLWNSESYSDVTIFTNGKEFSAHKVILAARCPFFKTLFEHDTQVKSTSRVNMTDLDQEVVKEMLRYIYSNGEVSNLEDFTPNLLIAAEKCEWANLKASCERFISSQLSIENAVEYFKLGDTYFAPHLKNKAKDYMVAHAADIVSTAGFNSLITTHPLLVEEIFSALIQRIPAK